ncbi:MAG: hypothetical protein JRG76_14815 [Deltaproteobacteria bacterium]|nr:hypothetical protein [Deltaproteobacteria bacterium]MBW2415773.1 hypothetical protein [Deltaproteobacteria bacterium]
MLPLLYGEDRIVRQVLEDPQTAEISELHKLAWRWTRRFVRESWTFGLEHVRELRDQGIDDAELLRWVEGAAVQTWWVMSADAGGVSLDEFTPTSGRAVGLEREDYEAQQFRTAAASAAALEALPAPAPNGVAWVEIDLDRLEYREAAASAVGRYGFVPNFLKAFSLRPPMYRRHLRAFELLEAPTTPRLTPRLHALARALTTLFNRSAYGQVTSRAQLERVTGDPELWQRLSEDEHETGWSDDERAVLDFAARMAQGSYRVTDKDAARFIDVGLDAAAYVEVANVVSIQTANDRTANALGLVPDPEPILSQR